MHLLRQVYTGFCRRVTWGRGRGLGLLKLLDAELCSVASDELGMVQAAVRF